MKLPVSWLGEWVRHDMDGPALAQRLTMLGLEVDAIEPAGMPVHPLVAGRVRDIRPHPNADRLSLCQVEVGGEQALNIVCGARNVRVGGFYPVALPGASLPGGLVIKASSIRGEPSAGMLCSARELGLEAPGEGLLELDVGTAVGADASSLLGLDDVILDISITPNRADCFSVLGIAREVAASVGGVAQEPAMRAVAPAHDDAVAVNVMQPAACPRFLGRTIRGLRADASTPLWLRERLRRSGIRPIHPVVDITNYVMLELGQPMHAYDLACLRGGIQVRPAHAAERLTLLNDQEVMLEDDTLVIADDSGAIGLAGIIGGLSTAVTTSTRDIFLECAFFSTGAVAGRGRRYGLHTDASVRFERGVDPTIQATAMELATGMILAIAGGQPGPVSHFRSESQLPQRHAVPLRSSRLTRVLGTEIDGADVLRILRNLRMTVVASAEGWQVTPPAARFDIQREEDLIEEIARVYGYDRIGETPETAALRPATVGESPDPLGELGRVLMSRGYQEAITYSFIPARLAQQFGGADMPELSLSNPISADLAVMRQSLWPGLVLAAGENLRRQQPRVRLFESGTRFTGGAGPGHLEERCIAGVAMGARLPEQWGVTTAAVDFFDVKSDVQALLGLAGLHSRAVFEAAAHPALHPGRSARVTLAGKPVGWLGEIHPALARSLDLPPVVMFELLADPLLARDIPAYQPVSVFPAVRRDIAVVVGRQVPASRLLDQVQTAASAVLRSAFVFDIYTGPQVGANEKSVAIGLILQDTSRTLAEEDINIVLQAVRAALSREFGARIRE